MVRTFLTLSPQVDPLLSVRTCEQTGHHGGRKGGGGQRSDSLENGEQYFFVPLSAHMDRAVERRPAAVLVCGQGCGCAPALTEMIILWSGSCLLSTKFKMFSAAQRPCFREATGNSNRSPRGPKCYGCFCAGGGRSGFDEITRLLFRFNSG